MLERPSKRWRRLLPWFAFALIVDIVILTNVGLFDLAHPGRLGVSYDDLAASLLRGAATVSRASIRWEFFQVGDDVYMYFAPFPALLRVIPNALFPETFGHGSRLSCLLAVAIGMGAMLWMLVRTIGSSALFEPRRADRMIIVLFLGLCFGLPFPFLLTTPAIYHEAILWALCSSIVAISALVAPRRLELGHLWCFSVASAVSFLSKSSFGIPLYLLSALLFFTLFAPRGSGLARRSPELDEVRSISAARRAAVFLPIVFAGLFYAWYNFERFGSPFTFLDYQYYGGGGSLDAAFVELHGAFNPGRLPLSFYYYCCAQLELGSQFPFVGYTRPTVEQTTAALLRYRQPSAAVLAHSGWFVLIALYGLLGRDSEIRSRWLLRATAIVLLIEWALILSFFIISLRYSTELLPLLFFGFVIAMRMIAGSGLGAYARWKKLGVVAGIAIAVWTQLAMAHQHLLEPASGLWTTRDKALLVEKLVDLGWVFGPLAEYREPICASLHLRSVSGEIRVPESAGEGATVVARFKGRPWMMAASPVAGPRAPADDGFDCSYKLLFAGGAGEPDGLLRLTLQYDSEGAIRDVDLAGIKGQSSQWQFRERPGSRALSYSDLRFSGVVDRPGELEAWEWEISLRHVDASVSPYL